MTGNGQEQPCLSDNELGYVENTATSHLVYPSYIHDSMKYSMRIQYESNSAR